MNRRNTENLVEDLLRDFEYQVQVPYIMYRNAADEVTGIWFYNPQECEEVAHLFSRIHNAFSRASPKAKVSAIKSEFEEPEVAPAVPSVEDTLEQPTSSTLVPDDVEYKFVSALLKAAACIGATTGGTGTVQPNQSVGMVPSSSHASPSVISSESPALHSPLPSRTSSAPVMPLDTHRSSSAPTIQPASHVKPLLFPPVTSSLTAAPPLHPPLTIQQRQSTPLLQPFPLPTASPPPPYGAPLLQPFPPPEPSPLLTPAASYGPVLARDKVKGAMLRLAQNDDFIDMVYREIVKGQYL